MTITPRKPDSARQLGLGLLFGIVFGFLLQKGGVAKHEVLMGQFFLTDFTVIKVMLTAIIVGMLGIF
ncbi:MAG: YeeE/YedE family protein, partial [Lysobacterales bacterium]